MTTRQPLFTPTADRQAYDIAPAGVLLMLADMVYGPQDEPQWTGGPKTEAMILAMLAAARAGGYAQTDILHTLLVRGERPQRLELMARAACAAAGNDRIAALFESMRKGKQ
ncbi:MAG: hypothetical protein K9J77_05815 [Rhodoferax sp.]|nr:hypothetical protein [Rhodoferax sp.]